MPGICHIALHQASNRGKPNVRTWNFLYGGFRLLTYGRDSFQLCFGEGPCEALDEGGMLWVGGVYVEEGEGSWRLALHDVGHRLHPKMVWL